MFNTKKSNFQSAASFTTSSINMHLNVTVCSSATKILSYHVKKKVNQGNKKRWSITKWQTKLSGWTWKKRVLRKEREHHKPHHACPETVADCFSPSSWASQSLHYKKWGSRWVAWPKLCFELNQTRCAVTLSVMFELLLCQARCFCQHSFCLVWRMCSTSSRTGLSNWITRVLWGKK